MIIQKTYFSDIAREVLYEAWISQEMTIDPVVKIECNAVAGGAFKLYSEAGSGTVVMTGEFEEVIWNEKLKYTWQWEGAAEKTKVIVEFKQDTQGTVVELLHSGFLTQESKEMHDSGWDHYFKGLERKIKELS